jgi:small GTP-binding protein
MSTKKSYLFKVLTAGDGGVGKTTLLHRYIHDTFVANTQMTLGVEFFTKELEFEEASVMLQLWDFGGQEQFRFMLERYALGAKGALILFDLTRYITLESIEEWVRICRKGDPNLPILLIGSKLDMVEDIVVDDETALQIKEQFGFINFIKVSSKTGESVEETFKQLADLVLQKELS